jgi:hypothetical protein
VILDKMPPVNTPTSMQLDQHLLDKASTRELGTFTWVIEDSLGLSGYDSDNNVGSPDLMVEPTAEPAAAVPMEPEHEEAGNVGSPDPILGPTAITEHPTPCAAVATGEGQNEDYSCWLIDMGGEPYNPAPQDSGNQEAVNQMDRVHVTSPMHD